MSGSLDMSHADIIKSNNKSGSGNSWGQGRGRSRGLRIHNRFFRIHNRCFRSTNPRFSRSSPYLYAKTMRILRAMFPLEEEDGYPGFPHTNGTKLYLSNLDYCFSEEDIRELFSTVGDLKRYSIHYDRSGRSKGTAEVVFSRRSDALAAVKRYNNVHLDGKPMKIEIVGTNIITPGVGISNCTFRNSNGVLRGGQGRDGAQGWVRGGGNGRSFGRGRRQGRGHGEKVSAEALDTDLEEYCKANMETN